MKKKFLRTQINTIIMSIIISVPLISISATAYNVDVNANNINKEEIVSKSNNETEINDSSHIICDEDELLRITEENRIKELQGHFNPSNLLEESYVTVEQLHTILEGTALQHLAPIYVQIEETYNINVLFMVALTAHESAWGTSNRAIYDNNLTGFGVYDESAEGINSNTQEANLLLTAKCLYNEYFSPTGLYYYGLSVYDVNTSYCLGEDELPNYAWTDSITAIAYELQNKIYKIKKA